MSNVERKRGGEADAIVKLSDVSVIYSQLRRFGYYREAELLMIGCNCALRISDLLQLKNSDIVRREINGKVVGFIERTKEQKTQKKKDLTINHVGMYHVDKIVSLYPDNEFLFQSEGNRAGGVVKPVDASWVSRKFKEIRDHLGLEYRFSTHSMRKTFGYHAYKAGVDIHVLQKLFNHGNSSTTLAYIGITNKKVEAAYLENVIGLGIGE